MSFSSGERAPERCVDAVGDEARRAVGHQRVDAAGVIAAGRVEPPPTAVTHRAGSDVESLTRRALSLHESNAKRRPQVCSVRQIAKEDAMSECQAAMPHLPRWRITPPVRTANCSPSDCLRGDHDFCEYGEARRSETSHG